MTNKKKYDTKILCTADTVHKDKTVVWTPE